MKWNFSRNSSLHLPAVPFHKPTPFLLEKSWRRWMLIKNLILQQIRRTFPLLFAPLGGAVRRRQISRRYSEKEGSNEKKAEARRNPLEINLKSSPTPVDPERIECLVKRPIVPNREIVISFPDICRGSDQSWGSVHLLPQEGGQRSPGSISLPFEMAKSSGTGYPPPPTAPSSISPG